VSATGSAGLDWRVLDEMWQAAGEAGAFDAGWMSDHLSDASRERGGVAFEAFTTLGALAHRAPGHWLGVAVASATFRHPSVLAKQATVLDNATGGRFILGLGAGWHVGEHEAFGIPLPPPRERFDLFERTLRVLEALFVAGTQAGGATLDDPIVRLDHATLEPPPRRPGGPAIWLGGQRRRGIALAARYAEGWPMPGNRPGDVAYFSERREAIRRALEAAGRDPDDFDFAGQLDCGSSPETRHAAVETGRRFLAAGATHLILGVPAAGGPEGMTAMAREVAGELRRGARTPRG
jgi:alkanesulfonate monooxygenase SsuD/methylene tetrahydromethanopterin reductase-like flavin-dependent oxidoreductase (luciferase family)